MSGATSSPATHAADRSELQTALFLDLVTQHTNLALIFLGQVPHPETGQRVRELETARHFVDQLEMLEAKTRGNLNKQEETLLKQSLMAARMAFVTAVEHPPQASTQTAPPSAEPGQPANAPAASANAPATDPPAPASAASADPGQDDERKKFVKKY